MNVAGPARRLGATRRGHNWRIPLCPGGCGYPASLAEGENGKVLFFCHGGCSFDQGMSALVQYGSLDDDDNAGLYTPSVAVRQRDDDDRRRKIEQACGIYASAAPNELIGVYLRSRGSRLTSPVLRFLEAAPHRLGARLPAMIAPVVNVAGEQTGVHMTYLRADGSGKADLPKEFQRETRGLIRGGAIRLAAYVPDDELLTGEGLETTLSAMEIFGLPGWAAIYAGGLKTMELPPEVKRILIAADHDEAGRQCALAARDRWIAEGRMVRVKVPPVPGQDFNDVLLGRRRNAASP